jgi:hypothetical protein
LIQQALAEYGNIGFEPIMTDTSPSSGEFKPRRIGTQSGGKEVPMGANNKATERGRNPADTFFSDKEEIKQSYHIQD